MSEEYLVRLSLNNTLIKCKKEFVEKFKFNIDNIDNKEFILSGCQFYVKMIKKEYHDFPDQINMHLNLNELLPEDIKLSTDINSVCIFRLNEDKFIPERIMQMIK